METADISHWLDITIVVLYFCVLFAVGLWTLCRPNRGHLQSYFLADRSMPWFAVGASIFSSNVGSEHFVGLAGAGAAGGIALILFEWLPIYVILMLAWLFLPVYISAKVYTLPEYIEKRHGGSRIRIYLSCIALILYVITKLAAAMFSGALFIQIALGWDMYLSMAVILGVTGVFTLLGGLTAVMYTDTFQTVIMVLGSTVVMIVSFIKIGGYSNIQRLYFDSIPSHHSNNTTCGLPRPDAFHVFQDPVTGDQPWPGLVLQASIGGIWHWCCDQLIVQRSLAAKSLSHAKGGAILAGTLKILPLYFLILPGMISRILFPDEVGCTDPDICKAVCDNPVGCSNIAYPKLVMELLPIGARGLLMAVMLSAIMSSLTSIFNSASTVFTMDIWRKIRPVARQRELLLVGRLFVIVMCVLAILWVPMIKEFQNGRLFVYMVSVAGYLGSPVGVLFILSVFSSRTTEAGAFYGLLAGHTLGIIRLVCELLFPPTPCGVTGNRPAILSRLHFTYSVQIELLFTALVITGISLVTKRRTKHELVDLTWWTRQRVDQDTAFELNRCGEEKHDREQESATPINNSKTDLQDDNTNDGTTPVKAQTLLHIICGTNSDVQTTSKLTRQLTNEFLTQDTRVSKCLNIVAMILMLIVAFVIGVYN